MTELSVVVPCFNEEAALPRFFDEVIPRIDRETLGSWEIIAVDDGSSDATWQVITNRSEQEKRIRGISLSRNFGHQPAVDTGLVFAAGNYVAVLDCDLQDPPEVLVQLLRKVRQDGYDVCYGVRSKRDAPLALKVFYKLFYKMMGVVAEHTWPADAGDFSVFNRRVLQAFLAMPESIRMLRGLRSWVGFKQASVAYDRPARKDGVSKYNLWRLMALAVRAFVGFSQLPLRFATFIGFGMVALSALLGLFFLLNRFVPGIAPFGYHIGENPGTTTVVMLMLFVTSMLFICLGIIGEYLSVLVKEIKRRPTSIVNTMVGNPVAQVHAVPVLFTDRPPMQIEPSPSLPSLVGRHEW